METLAGGPPFAGGPLCPPLLAQLPALLAQLGPSFPRGTGFYFSLLKLALFLAAFLAWVRVTHWVNGDAEEVNLQQHPWNGLLLGAGVLGVALLWALPSFWLSYPALLLLVGAAAGVYVQTRNRRVPADERVLTERHLRQLLTRYLRLQFKPRKAVEEEARRIPVRFIGRRFGEREADPRRVQRAEGSKGYRAALQMVYDAIQMRATDIHMEPTRDEMAVRFRIDGVMHQETPFSRGMGDAVINIFKVLASMDITERRKPQDGSFSAEVEGRSVDFRVATAGSVLGEKLVMRVLDRAYQIISLEKIGMREKMREQVRAAVTRPNGLFVVCGPTGSGKSTTLYACLNELDRYQLNIITIENPVEYQLTGITQIEVNPKAGKTFASELRSILRQDPDAIMIGEVRDDETAEIACQAAQTGHMVFTTLHANDTVTAIGRLLDLGVQPFLIASSLTAVLGQRLVRVLCPKCKVRYKPNPDMLRKANLPADKIKYFYKAAEEPGGEAEEAGAAGACDHCGGTGYHGRTGVFELLVVTDKIREMIRENPNLIAIKQEAVKGGMRYLHEDGFRQVIEGRTSVQELMRISK